MKEKTVENLADLVAGATAPGVMATLLAAAQSVITPVAAVGGTAAVATTAAVFTPAAVAGIAVCATALFAWSHFANKGSVDSEKAFRDRFRILLDEQGSLKRLLERLAVGQIEMEIDQSASQERLQERASELLTFVRAAEQDRRAAAADHTALLIHVGEQLNQRSESMAEVLAEVHRQGATLAAELTAAITKSTDTVTREIITNRALLESAADAARVRDAKIDELLRRTALAPRPHHDLQAEIDQAVDDCNSGDFGGGRKVFKQIRERSWPDLTGAQRFRVLYNLAVITEQIDIDLAAAGDLFISAADACPEHDEAEAVRALGLLNHGEFELARTMAELAIKKSPAADVAWAAWLHARDETTTLADVLNRIPPAQQARPNTAYHLGVFAQQREDFERAIEFHRLAEAGSGHPFAGLQLGLSLINRHRIRYSITFGNLDDLAQGELAEALERIEAFLVSRTSSLSTADRARLHQMKGMACGLLGRPDDEHFEYESARKLDPSNTEVLALRAIVLADRSQLDRAITELKPAIAPANAVSEILTLVHLLQRRGTPADHQEVLGLIESALGQHDDGEESAALLRHYIASGAKSGEWDRAFTTAEQWWPRIRAVEIAVQRFHFVALRATSRAGEPESERSDGTPAATADLDALLTQAENAVRFDFGQRDPTAFEPRELQFYYWAARVFTQHQARGAAFEIYRTLLAAAPREHPLFDDLMQAAQAVGDDLFLREQCERVMKAGTVDWRIVLLAADLEFNYGDFAKAIELLDRGLTASTDAVGRKVLRLRLAGLALVTGDQTRLALSNQETLGVDQLPISMADQYVKVLLADGKARAALDAASAFVRKFPDNASVRDTLVRAVMELHRSPLQTEALHPPVIGVGCAVRYSVDGKDGEWVLVEDDGPNFHEHERPADHPFVKPLIGRGIGHAFEFGDPLAPQKGRIEYVGHRAFGIAALTVKEYASRFPGREPVVSVIDVGTGVRGEIDAEKALGLLTRVSRGPAEGRRTAFERRRRERFPVSALCRMVSASEFTVVTHLASDPNESLCFCTGSAAELEEAQRTFQEAEELVLAPDAAAVLFLADVHRAAPLTLPKRLLITQRLLFGIRREASRLRDNAAAAAHVGWDDGIRFVEHDERYTAAHVQTAESLEAFADWLAHHGTIVDSWELAKLPAPFRRQLIDVLGPPAAEAVAIAHAKATRVLWSDDIALPHLTAAELPVRRVWSQIVFPAIDGQASPEADFGHDLACWLCRAGFGFTRITPSSVLRQLNRVQWQADDDSLNRLLSAYLETGVSTAGYLRMVHGLLFRILSHAPTFQAAMAVSQRFLGHVADHPAGVAIIHSLERQWSLSPEVPVDIKLTMRLAVDAWRGRAVRYYFDAGIPPGDPLWNGPEKGSTGSTRRRPPRPKRGSRGKQQDDRR